METAKTIQAAVEGIAAEQSGYVNTVEGYGDMCRQLLALQADIKECKRQCGEAVNYLDDGQTLSHVIDTAYIIALRLTYTAATLCAKLKRYRETALPEGDLLDMMEGYDDDDSEA